MSRDDDEPLLEDGTDPPVDEDETVSNRARVLNFARRLTSRRDLAEDSKLLLSAFLSTSDKAKTETVRLMAREFRSYLKELRLKEDLLELARSHSLEISIHLKPLARPDEPSGSGSGE
ncbi:MAG: hypothetical protein ABMA64_06330 [Myxococcota bacterium]